MNDKYKMLTALLVLVVSAFLCGFVTGKHVERENSNQRAVEIEAKAFNEGVKVGVHFSQNMTFKKDGELPP